MHINDNFAKFSEALFVADRHAREEVRQRSVMQQKLVEKEKASKEEHLRQLAQKAREGRSGIAPTSSRPTAEGKAAMQSSLAAYGSGSESGSDKEDSGSDDDDEARRVRDEMRAEKRRDRERELRMNNMGTEQRAKMLARYAFLSNLQFPFH